MTAMVSFSYNTPMTHPIFTNDNCLKGFQGKNKASIKKCFAKYSWLGGLKKRRNAELDLFFTK